MNNIRKIVESVKNIKPEEDPDDLLDPACFKRLKKRASSGDFGRDWSYALSLLELVKKMLELWNGNCFL